MTPTQALRVAKANQLRKRVNFDLRCRLDPNWNDPTAYRKAAPADRRRSEHLVRKEMQPRTFEPKTILRYQTKLLDGLGSA